MLQERLSADSWCPCGLGSSMSTPSDSAGAGHNRGRNCIPSVYQNCGSVPTALPRWRNSVDNPLLARNDFDRDDAKATHSRSRLPRLNRQRLLSLLLTKCPRTTRAHRSRADRRSGTRPLRAAYGYPTPFPNLRRTIKKLRRRLSPSPTPPCQSVANSGSVERARIRHTPSCQQAFRLRGLRQWGSGPTTAGVSRVGRSDWVRPWRIQNREDLFRALHCQRSCIRILAIFLRTRERLFPARAMPRPEWWSPGTTTAIAHSTRPSSWALCSPVR